LRRLDEQKIAHTDPIRTTEEGQEGTAIRFVDPDGNHYEFWAPARMPAGAMAGETPAKVGRISHAVYESRDLDRTADFFDPGAAAADGGSRCMAAATTSTTGTPTPSISSAASGWTSPPS